MHQVDFVFRLRDGKGEIMIHTTTIETNDATIQLVNDTVYIWRQDETSVPGAEIDYDEFMSIVSLLKSLKKMEGK